MLKKILIVLIIIPIVWVSIFALDYMQVKSFGEPTFSILVENEKDFKKYVGIGYFAELHYGPAGFASLYCLNAYEFNLFGKTIAKDFIM